MTTKLLWAEKCSWGCVLSFVLFIAGFVFFFNESLIVQSWGSEVSWSARLVPVGCCPGSWFLSVNFNSAVWFLFRYCISMSFMILDRVWIGDRQWFIWFEPRIMKKRHSTTKKRLKHDQQLNCTISDNSESKPPRTKPRESNRTLRLKTET
jgi:hypothetical protein